MTHKMPVWLRRFFLFVLPRILWMDAHALRETSFAYHERERSLVIENPVHIDQVISILLVSPTIIQLQDHRLHSHDSLATYLHDKHRTSTILVKPIPQLKSSHHYHARKEPQAFTLTNSQTRLVPINPEHHRQRIQLELMRRELSQALGDIRYIAEHCAHDAVLESVRNEWKYIAIVIDRLQFVTFSAATIIGSLALLFQVRLNGRRSIFLFIEIFSLFKVPNMFQMHSDPTEKLVRFANPNLTIYQLIPNVRN